MPRKMNDTSNTKKRSTTDYLQDMRRILPSSTRRLPCCLRTHCIIRLVAMPSHTTASIQHISLGSLLAVLVRCLSQARRIVHTHTRGESSGCSATASEIFVLRLSSNQRRSLPTNEMGFFFTEPRSCAHVTLTAFLARVRVEMDRCEFFRCSRVWCSR